MEKQFMLGNGAIALGLLEAGCQVVTSYPGTPSSEILPEVVHLKKQAGLDTYVEWSTNEKVALDNAFAAAVAGKRSACCMKQVGLNVAADTLMSAAYLGTIGGLVIISCDDPGPHSSQTEQDSRLMARLAKIPVFDPSDPSEARKMVAAAFDLSEAFQVPVLLRPAIRVCHARQSLAPEPLQSNPGKAAFDKDPLRWAATPKFRLKLHGDLNRKLEAIGQRFDAMVPFNAHNLAPDRHYPLGIAAGGVPVAVIQDLLETAGREDIPLLKLGAPYPFPEGLAATFTAACDRVLVIEETDTVIEYLFRDRHKTMGRLSGHVPAQGELVPQVIAAVLDDVLVELGLPALVLAATGEAEKAIEPLELPIRRPTLCPGCPHRASFFAIRKFKPKAIFTSDIGCYTLGLNLGGVDTCVDMGAGITMASGFHQAFKQDGVDQPVIATMGDSTFFHSGTAGLINAVYNDARFILVILDNLTTAMTGMQPSIALGVRADGSRGRSIPLERIVSGCGVDFIETVDPYDLQTMRMSLKRAAEHAADPEGGVAVIIARRPCLIAFRGDAVTKPVSVTVTDECDACNFCHTRFECPALTIDAENGKTAIDRALCCDCGVCVNVCPRGAIVAQNG